MTHMPLNAERLLAMTALAAQAISTAGEIDDECLNVRLISHYIVSDLILMGKAIHSIVSPGKVSAALLGAAVAYNLYVKICIKRAANKRR